MKGGIAPPFVAVRFPVRDRERGSIGIRAADGGSRFRAHCKAVSIVRCIRTRNRFARTRTGIEFVLQARALDGTGVRVLVSRNSSE